MPATEVCVLGGGPAGSTIARQLALLGHQVLLVERHAFPRSQVGESFSMGILSLLDTLGLRERVERAGLLRPHRVRLNWGPTSQSAPDDFTAAGFQVDRGQFDHLLLEAAREAGVMVLQPARAQSPVYATDRWRISLEQGGVLLELTARYLVDATGRRGVLLGQRRRFATSTLALHGYWHDCPLARVPVTYLEAAPTHWLWGGPLPDGTFAATIFLDTNRHKPSKGEPLEQQYRSLLSKSILLRDCLSGRLQLPVGARDATPTYTIYPVDSTFIRVGDANFSLDPLATQGVQTAIAGAMQGSAVVHTILTQPQNKAAAIDFYISRQQEAVRQHRALAAQYYAEPLQWQHQAFWAERSAGYGPVALLPAISPHPLPSPHTLVQCSAQAEIISLPCLTGNIITNLKAIRHFGLSRPVAYWADIQLAPLLETLMLARTVADIILKWAAQIPVAKALAIFRWLWSQQIIVASPTS